MLKPNINTSAINICVFVTGASTKARLRVNSYPKGALEMHGLS